MADKRAEARRRRILENPSERLKKLQYLSKCEDFSIADTPSECSNLDQNKTSTTSDIVDENNFVKTVEPDILENENISIESTAATTKTTETDNMNLDEVVVKPSWLSRKYRLILFLLLGWSMFMVIEKDFDFIFAYIIGQKLPKDVLSYLFITVFIAVESQVTIAYLVFGKANEEQSAFNLLNMALSFCGLPKGFLVSLGKLFSLFFLIMKDFCVYLFMIVILKTLD